MARCLTTRRSPRIGMAASVTAICCESYSRPWSGAAWPRGWSFAVDASLIAADANKQRSAAGSNDVDWEAIARMRRSVREYLDTLDEAAWGAASETVLKFISRSDPAAQWTGAPKGHAFFAYADNYLIDLKAAVILDVEATRAIRQAEVGAAKTMIERIAERFGLRPDRLAADGAYGSAPSLARRHQGDCAAYPGV